MHSKQYCSNLFPQNWSFQLHNFFVQGYMPNMQLANDDIQAIQVVERKHFHNHLLHQGLIWRAGAVWGGEWDDSRAPNSSSWIWKPAQTSHWFFFTVSSFPNIRRKNIRHTQPLLLQHSHYLENTLKQGPNTFMTCDQIDEEVYLTNRLTKTKNIFKMP